MRRLVAIILALPLALAFAQQPADPPPAATTTSAPALSAPAAPAPAAITSTDGRITIPSGTQIPLVLKQAISTKNAKAGDAVYAETAFPITLNDKVVIPAGTYVQGRVDRGEARGRVKGRAEILHALHHAGVIRAVTRQCLPGAVENMPGAETSNSQRRRREDQAGRRQDERRWARSHRRLAPERALAALASAERQGRRNWWIGWRSGRSGICAADPWCRCASCPSEHRCRWCCNVRWIWKKRKSAGVIRS